LESNRVPDYTAFSVTDFVLDDSFVRWVKNPSEEDRSFWDNWVLQNPDKGKTVAEARMLVSSIRFGEDFNTPENIEQTWDVLSARFEDQRQPARSVIFNARFLMRFAAAISLIGLVASLIWFQMPPGEAELHTYRTGNGETVTFKLSDSSQVVLNANSSMKIRMRSGWNPGREAWIQGEAFFKIKKQQSRTTFTVHTSNVDVHVLGTEFNVTDRHDISTVVLNSGQIKINNTIGPAQELTMKPGDLATFSDTSRYLGVRQVNPEHYNAWIYQKLIFDHTSISEVAQMLEDIYGLSVEIARPALAKRTFTATLPSNSLPVLLKALEESFNVTITKLDKKLIITDK
jgi:transmembrane sensor